MKLATCSECGKQMPLMDLLFHRNWHAAERGDPPPPKPRGY